MANYGQGCFESSLHNGGTDKKFVASERKLLPSTRPKGSNRIRYSFLLGNYFRGSYTISFIVLFRLSQHRFISCIIIHTQSRCLTNPITTPTPAYTIHQSPIISIGFVQVSPKCSNRFLMFFAQFLFCQRFLHQVLDWLTKCGDRKST